MVNVLITKLDKKTNLLFNFSHTILLYNFCKIYKSLKFALFKAIHNFLGFFS